MTTSFSQRLWNSVSRQRKLPQSRSPYDQVPYTGTGSVIDAGLLAITSKFQQNWPRRDPYPNEDTFPVGYQKNASERKAFGRWFQSDLVTHGMGASSYLSHILCGSSSNARSQSSSLDEHRSAGRTSRGGRFRQTSTVRALFSRAPVVDQKDRGGSEVLHTAARSVMRSTQRDQTKGTGNAFRLEANVAHVISQSGAFAKRNTQPFVELSSCRQPTMNAPMPAKSQRTFPLTERLAIQSPLLNANAAMSALESSKLAADLSPPDASWASNPRDGNSLPMPEFLQSNVGRGSESQLWVSDEIPLSAMQMPGTSFRERVKRSAKAIDATRSVVPFTPVNGYLASTQASSLSEFPHEVPQASTPELSTNVTQNRWPSGSDVIAPPTDDVKRTRPVDLTSIDFEKKRAARMNARPRRMLPRIQ